MNHDETKRPDADDLDLPNDPGFAASFDDLPGDDLPGDDCWAEADAPQPIAVDFVDRVTAAVRAERIASAADAADLDDADRAGPDPILAPSVLSSYAVPEPSAGFVSETLALLQSDRADRADRDRRTAEMLAQYEPPTPDAEFVDRTLDALRIDRSPLQLVGDSPTEETSTQDAATPDSAMGRTPTGREVPELQEIAAAAPAPDTAQPRRAAARAAGPRPTGAQGPARKHSLPRPVAEPVTGEVARDPRRQWLLSWGAATAAAALLFMFLLPGGGEGNGGKPHREALEALTTASAQEFTPAPLATTWSRAQEPNDSTLRFEPGDALLQLAALTASQEDGGRGE